MKKKRENVSVEKNKTEIGQKTQKRWGLILMLLYYINHTFSGKSLPVNKLAANKMENAAWLFMY